MPSTWTQIINTHTKSFITFALVGLLSAVIYFGLISVLWEWMGLNYLAAVAAAYLLTVVIQFNLNRYLTFRSHTGRLLSHIKKYVIMVSVNLMITVMIVDVSVQVLQMSPYWGAAFAIGVTVLVGYVMAKFWIFK
jgi:putative flippase GtrA